MKPIAIDRKLFSLNRDRLRKLLPKNALVVVNANDSMPTNADGTMGFHQNADLFYLTGINQEETVLVLIPDAFDEKQREMLFVRQPNEHLATWEGHKLSTDQAAKLSGIKSVRWLSDLPSTLHALMSEAEVVYLNGNEHARSSSEVETRDVRFVNWCKSKYPLHEYRRLARPMHELRAVKSKFEIDLIRRASNITGKAFDACCGS